MSNYHFTRRDFMRMASAGAVTVGASSVLGACVSRDVEGPPGRTGAKVVRYAMSGKATSADVADPALSNSQHDGRLMTAVYEQLTRYDESLKAVPWLAESWDHNETATEWQFKLRGGVLFHDGQKLTAKDVVHSFRRVLDPDTASPGAALLADLDPDGIEAVDDRTVRFRLRSPNGDLPLALITKQSFIVPDGATTADLKRTAVGTGALRLKEFTPGEDRTVFEKNAKYRESGLPKLERFELLSIAESAARVAALERGQADIIEAVPVTALDRLGDGSGTQIVSQPKGDMPLIAMQTDVAPFDDNRVRQALKYALNRADMMKLVIGGQGSILNDIPISSELQYGLSGEARAHDVAKAKQLLAEAGHPDGLDVELAVSDVQAGFMDFATAFKAMAREAGINVKLDVSPADAYWEDVWLKTPMFVGQWIARPTESMLGLLFLSDSSSNETHWNRPDWEKSFERARGSLNEAERQTIFGELQQEVVNEGGYLVPYMWNTISAARADVTGWQPSGTFFENFAAIDLGS